MKTIPTSILKGRESRSTKHLKVLKKISIVKINNIVIEKGTDFEVIFNLFKPNQSAAVLSGFTTTYAKHTATFLDLEGAIFWESHIKTQRCKEIKICPK
jgi:hypothetical protein